MLDDKWRDNLKLASSELVELSDTYRDDPGLLTAYHQVSWLIEWDCRGQVYDDALETIKLIPHGYDDNPWLTPELATVLSHIQEQMHWHVRRSQRN